MVIFKKKKKMVCYPLIRIYFYYIFIPWYNVIEYHWFYWWLIFIEKFDWSRFLLLIIFFFIFELKILKNSITQIIDLFGIYYMTTVWVVKKCYSGENRKHEPSFTQPKSKQEFRPQWLVILLLKSALNYSESNTPHMDRI